MSISKSGDIVELEREQWRGHKARITDYPGLLDAIKKYTWTYSSGQHPYLQSNKADMSLHKFVLCYLYGYDAVEKMLLNGNIIEHLDNDGLNCTFDNLHIISADYNKAKAFTIDKETLTSMGIPHFVTDVYYSHQGKYYQMQVFFNNDLLYVVQPEKAPTPVEELFLQYNAFHDLYLDWLYILGCREAGTFDIKKFHYNKWFCSVRPYIEITEDEKDKVIIERDGKFYLNIRTSGDRIAYLNHTHCVHLEEIAKKLDV